MARTLLHAELGGVPAGAWFVIGIAVGYVLGVISAWVYSCWRSQNKEEEPYMSSGPQRYYPHHGSVLQQPAPAYVAKTHSHASPPALPALKAAPAKPPPQLYTDPTSTNNSDVEKADTPKGSKQPAADMFKPNSTVNQVPTQVGLTNAARVQPSNTTPTYDGLVTTAPVQLSSAVSHAVPVIPANSGTAVLPRHAGKPTAPIQTAPAAKPPVTVQPTPAPPAPAPVPGPRTAQHGRNMSVASAYGADELDSDWNDVLGELDGMLGNYGASKMSSSERAVAVRKLIQMTGTRGVDFALKSALEDVLAARKAARR